VTITEARLRKLVDVFATVQGRNTDEWLDYAAAEINSALCDLGDTDRVERHGESLWIKKGVKT
jgi:hypothetical protein